MTRPEAPQRPAPTGQLLRSVRSFRYAGSGLIHLVRTQSNARVHAVLTVLALGLAAWLRPPNHGWMGLIIVIGVVWMAEAFNTAIEAVVDLTSPEIHPWARIAKDAAAAGVLIAALTALAVGVLVLGPPLWACLRLVL